MEKVNDISEEDIKKMDTESIKRLLSISSGEIWKTAMREYMERKAKDARDEHQGSVYTYRNLKPAKILNCSGCGTRLKDNEYRLCSQCKKAIASSRTSRSGRPRTRCIVCHVYLEGREKTFCDICKDHLKKWEKESLEIRYGKTCQTIGD